MSRPDSEHRRATRWLASGPRLAGLIGVLLLCACKSQDDARVQQLLNQRGFGKRFVGDTNEQYYLGIGDTIQVIVTDAPEFNGVYHIRPDAVIDVPLIGEITVGGLTLPDVSELLTRRFQEYVTTARADVQLGASVSKFYYIEGEVRGRGVRPFRGGTDLFSVVFDSQPTILADEDDIRLIRSDPINPLVVHFDYDDHLVGGWSRGNIEVRENDIIYIPPNTLGYMSLALEGLLAPLQRAFLGVLQASRLVALSESFGDARFGGGGGRFNRFGGFGFGSSFDGEELLADDPSGEAPRSAGEADGR